MHAPNPFDDEVAGPHRTQLEQSRARLEVEVRYLKDILWTHAKIGLAFEAGKDQARVPANPETAWIVSFGKADDDQVCMALANVQTA